jgi:hypothetical protein
MVSYSTDAPVILHPTAKSNCYRLGLVVTMTRGCAPLLRRLLEYLHDFVSHLDKSIHR